ncbi:MAG: alpha-glucan family phosphorylase, partial [Spirochaetes bacterium]|nr:alpha-glucan family phosphorylase [Spirochaetota bacterium]
KSFTVLPAAPEKLAPLLEMAYNMWFSWNWEATWLYSQLSRKLWEEANENPLLMLSLIPQERLEEVSCDSRYMADLESVYGRYKQYLAAATWWEKHYGKADKPKVAYFSCEYGIHESLPVYSGGLGVLSGDHLKSASDLGIPLCGVGLLYRTGYFQQYLNMEGYQQESYLENTWYNMPVKLLKDEAGQPILESIPMGDETVYFHIWEVAVGRVPLYLLDTSIEKNDPRHQAITIKLYDSDRDVRIRQEILLGMGGMKALRRLGIEPEICHINEGHSAFLILERYRRLMKEDGLSLQEAGEVIRATSLFTTHTPVPAGNERFHPDLLRRYFEHTAKDLGLDWNQFMAMGREYAENAHEEFCMTVLALKNTAYANGVAKLHGHVSRHMWRNLFKDLPAGEVPIGSVTNGVHTSTWISPQLKRLFTKYQGAPKPQEPAFFDGDLANPADWEVIDRVPADELWAMHQERRKILVSMARERMKSQLQKKWARPAEIAMAEQMLDPDILTIGFARRFATYKRGYLFLKNPERLLALLKHPERPIQFIIAGKAHPADNLGKDVIKQIYNFAVRYKCQDRIVFLENYDLRVARYLVQGVDVWLNNPRRPLEASGTSGMKAAVNGVLNFSILDGWWDEGYSPDTGWAIGTGEEYEDPAYQDDVEGDLLYRTIEQSIVPLFYGRSEKGTPEGWVKMMQASIRKHGMQFNTHRMLIEYTRFFYEKGIANHQAVARDGYARIKAYAAWLAGVREAWDRVRVVDIHDHTGDEIRAGSNVQIHARIDLGGLAPESVLVEVYHGPTNKDNQVEGGYRTPMVPGAEADGLRAYSASVLCQRGGRYGYAVRILPRHESMLSPFITGLIRWN